MSSFEGKVIAISGSASGIGFATAQELVARGAIVSLADSNEVGLEAALQKLPKTKGGLDHLATVIDVRNSKDVNSWIKNTVQKYGRLDGAVNAAGVARDSHPIKDETDEGWDFVMAVNGTGMFYSLRAQLNHVSVGGAIVNIASVAGAMGFPGSASYCASKHAVLGLTRTAARENPDIRVNAVLPGIIDTPMTEEVAKKRGGDLPTAQLSLNRMGKASEVANIIVFLISSEASFVTGAAYAADGGLLC